MVDVPVPLACGVVCLGSGLLVFISLREHLAWPVFLVAGLAALRHGGFVPAPVQTALQWLAAAIALAAAAMHAYWAIGGQRWIARAVPERPDGTRLFTAGPLACAAVAMALSGFAALLVMAPGPSQPWLRHGLTAAALVLTARLIGDGRFVGFFKRYHNTRFGRADGALYTPLVVFLWLGALASLAP